MKRGLKAAYAAAAAIFALGITGSIILSGKPNSSIAEVVRDGEVLYRFDLSTAQAQTVKIEYGGSYNIIEISSGQIRVSEAACPDNTCVKMGALSGGSPVVCLPNHLVIRFAGEETEDVDGAVR